MNDKISVIVAVYNTASYLEKCIDALLNQTLKNIEIIIIEDKSTDNSASILKKYTKNKHIKIIFNKENKGLASARNKGLEIATGTYIGFIDSDDYIEANYYELLYKSIKKTKANIAVCDMKLIYSDNTFKTHICGDSSGDKLSFINNPFAASACNKLFEKSLINKYRFEEGKINEDIAVVIPILAEAKKISYVPNCYYNYYQRTSSIQNSTFNNRRFDVFDGLNTLAERIKGNHDFDNIMEATAYNQLFMFFLYAIPNEGNLFKRAKYYKVFQNLASTYRLDKNRYVIADLNRRGKKAHLYYQLLLNLNKHKLYFLNSLVVSLYTLMRQIKHSDFLTNLTSVIKRNISLEDIIKCAKKQAKLKSDIKVSVVVPNYNYEEFLLARIYSILVQDAKIYELIILDDASSDHSRDVIASITSSIKDYVKVKTIYNKVNSGSAFKQWERGFSSSEGEYVWICEADDYCNKHLLKNLLRPIAKNANIIISYADTTFINKKGVKLFKTIKNEIDIKSTGHWNHDYINNGKSEFQDYTYLNNTIANVSSTLIKNVPLSDAFALASSYRQAGDWLIYSSLMEKGDVAFTAKTLNYYREHGNNVSSITKKEAHLEEILKIYSFYIKKYNLNAKHKKDMQARIDFLQEQWGVKTGGKI